MHALMNRTCLGSRRGTLYNIMQAVLMSKLIYYLFQLLFEGGSSYNFFKFWLIFIIIPSYCRQIP